MAKSIILATLLMCSAASADTFIVTAYSATGRLTASGVVPKEGVTCAGPRDIPFGTVVEIEGVGVRIVQDRMNKRFPKRWDVFYEKEYRALAFGIKEIKVSIVPKTYRPRHD